ncbi:bifunctional diguanylate cyclase/phosphodiesterase [Pseudalkalibacillus caeni]|uniref:EAL domain-containing protein n=1 Tax=Exobacillus caeni TaxID=2574798 RepID=A0A5R9F5V0_9BACL|nr:EAL domain-containing protein [Pseudalkalibacillus caeni]TLS37869.1 EAL domain-containing protein [Pseudalkalibacillus caeni]
MRTYTTLFNTIDELSQFIDTKALAKQASVFVMIHAEKGHSDLPLFISRQIKQMIPAAKIVGISANGLLHSGFFIEGKVLLTFSVFEKTQITTTITGIEKSNDLYLEGKQLAEQLIQTNTKLIVLYTAGVTNDEAFIKGVHSVSRDVIVVGGHAGYGSGFLVTDEKIIKKGIVAAAFNNPKLQVKVFQEIDWKAEGKIFEVTRSNKNRIYSIDGIEPVELYRKYLGEEISRNLPGSASQIPLINISGDTDVPLHIVRRHSDGSITVNKKIEPGDKLQFSFGEAASYVEASKRLYDNVSNVPTESIYVFSSEAVKNFFNKSIAVKLNPLEDISPVNGCFLHGEFYITKNGISNSVNSSLIVSIAEKNVLPTVQQTTRTYTQEMKDLDGLKALSHLIKASTEELELLNTTLQHSEQKYKSLFDQNPNLVYSVDMQGRITSANPALQKVLEYEPEEVMRKNALKFVSREYKKKTRERFYQALNGVSQTYDSVLLSKSGERIAFTITNIPIVVNGKIVGAYGIGKNIHRQREAEETIAHLAYYDALTDLPNRLLFENLVEQSLKKANDRLAIMFIDLDRFKLINDSLGHNTGDLILKEVSGMLKQVIKDEAVLARFGGDEFTVLMPRITDEKEALLLSQKVIDALNQPIIHNEQEYYISASIGISISPYDGKELDRLMRNAYIAMDRAKTFGANRIEFYTDEMNGQTFERLELESYLRRAIEKNELILYYQPQISLDEQEIYACEALIRWNHPKLGLVSPAQFIPLAEETGLIEDIGIWVLNEACNQTRQWQLLGFPELSISVNVSGRQFQSPAFVASVKQALNESGLPPHCLHLEVTESTTLANTEYSKTMLNELRSLGIKVSIDDFGTGYSSLSYLKDFPLDILKIDQSFVRNIQENNADAAIVKAVITMCQGLNLSIVAEGIETKEQGEIIKSFGCQYGQGYFYSKPLSKDTFERLLFRREEPVLT